jgi:hypothetical protein
MATHYPHANCKENHQGLHYSGFWTFLPGWLYSKQSVTRRAPREIVKLRGESAKLG